MHPTAPIENQICEEKPPLDTRQPFLHAPPAQLHHEPTTEMDLHPSLLPHGHKLRKLDERFAKWAAATLASTTEGRSDA
jgi:hypothetical protein